ncbi:MAG: hypothetical protein NTV94_09560 [Planctomycetota bacterium]|nr:hypothetical protein [Planctomycetota bacterium]
MIATLAIVSTAATGFLWSGCTVTTSNYKTLSRFFDGVPDPNAVVAADGSGGPAQMPNLSIHEPYSKEACSECHNTGVRLSRESSSLCLKCHEKVPGEHQQMHGPVAAGACLWCHSPHESPYKHLLREADPKVCTQCHTPSLLDASRVPAHGEATRSCLECHFGHGGPERYQLKPGIAGAVSLPAEK